jgi:hypothetical protein
MEKLCYIRVSFKKAVKKDYPIYYKQPYPVRILNMPINKELIKENYTYKYNDAIFDINGKSDSRSYYLYSKIPLIYSNIGYWIIVIIMSSGLAFLTQVKLTDNPMRLYVFIIFLVTWVNLFKYWQKNKLDKWIIKKLNK